MVMMMMMMVGDDDDNDTIQYTSLCTSAILSIYHVNKMLTIIALRRDLDGIVAHSPGPNICL